MAPRSQSSDSSAADSTRSAGESHLAFGLRGGWTSWPDVWPDDQWGGTLLKEEPVIIFSYAAAEAVTEGSLTELS